MSRIISVVNQKGGVGKTSITEALLAGLTQKGFKCLGIDLDSQMNLTSTFGENDEEGNVLNILKREIEAKDIIQRGKYCDLIPASRDLSGADIVLTQTGKEFRLQEGLSDIRKAYDWIIIDSGPSLGILTVNALATADQVLIPAQADIYSLQGIQQLYSTFELVKRYCNPDLFIEGILLNRYNPRTVLSREIAGTAEQMAHQLGTKVFMSKIREAVAVKEAQLQQKSIFEYAPKANVTKDYENFINEVLKGYEEK